MTTRPRGFSLVELMVVIAIIAVFLVLLSSFTTGPINANPRAVSAQIVGTMNLAKQRAISTRRWHRVEVTGPAAAIPNSVLLWQWSDLGMATPAGTCIPGPPTSACWQVVQSTTLPKSVAIHYATTTVSIASGTTVTQNTALDFFFSFRPDGSSTGGTLFLTDTARTRPWRVVVYKATGSSYAREPW